MRKFVWYYSLSLTSNASSQNLLNILLSLAQCVCVIDCLACFFSPDLALGGLGHWKESRDRHKWAKQWFVVVHWSPWTTNHERPKLLEKMNHRSVLVQMFGSARMALQHPRDPKITEKLSLTQHPPKLGKVWILDGQVMHSQSMSHQESAL